MNSTSNQAKNEIYINSHVTPSIGRILHRGRFAVKEKKIAACWVTAKGLMVKTDQSSEPIVVTTMVEWDEILGPEIKPVVQPKAMITGKRTRNANDSISPTGNNKQPKSRPRITSSGKCSAGPKSSKEKHVKKSSNERTSLSSN